MAIDGKDDDGQKADHDNDIYGMDDGGVEPGRVQDIIEKARGEARQNAEPADGGSAAPGGQGQADDGKLSEEEEKKFAWGCLGFAIFLAALAGLLHILGLPITFWNMFFMSFIVGGVFGIIDAVLTGNILMAVLLPWFVLWSIFQLSF